MGVASLSKVTIISPRSEYPEVAKALAQFEDFHPVQEGGANFDPEVQELTVKAVRLFAQADQATKDLGLKLMPGQIDIVFRGEKIPRSDFEAGDWDELLSNAESQLNPILDQVRSRKTMLQKVVKEETDAENVRAALAMVSGFSSDLGGLSRLDLFSSVAVVVANERVEEFRNSIPEAIFLTQGLSKEGTLVLAIVRRDDAAKLDKTVKLLELKPISMPEGYPQNPAGAYRKASEDLASASRERGRLEGELAGIGRRDGTALLSVRELTEVARKMLDEARVSGSLSRMATISGYIPAKKEGRFREMFGRWIVDVEPVGKGEEGEKIPVLLTSAPGLSLYQPITKEQGIPGGHEVDPTPLVSFIFPIFFGMMFGDVGHGIILTLFFLFVRARAPPTGTMRQWANLFVVAGVSSIVFGVIFGEFFELSFSSFVPIPPVVEIIHRAAGSVDSFNFPPPGGSPFYGVYLVMIVAILIGVAHLTTALVLDVYQGTKEHNRLELFLEKIPVLTMYLSGVGYGLAFIGVGFHFDVLCPTASCTGPNPLLGVPDNLLGAVSLAVLLPSMLVLLLGKAVAIKSGRMKGAVGEALFNGGLEVFERISQFLSNTISYVRLAVMLLVHAALLLIINLMQPWSNPVFIVPWVILNLLILSFEAFIVYVQDLRLHLYEFFTKFFQGTGTPFRKILPDRVRFDIKWR